MRIKIESYHLLQDTGTSFIATFVLDDATAIVQVHGLPNGWLVDCYGNVITPQNIIDMALKYCPNAQEIGLVCCHPALVREFQGSELEDHNIQLIGEWTNPTWIELLIDDITNELFVEVTEKIEE